MPGLLPRILVAGPASGVGKTTAAVGLMAALRARKIAVQAFKTGPDYIDPSYHTLATGRPSRNLDTWMLPQETVHQLFVRGMRNAEIGVIEGVMGLFDGFSPISDEGSTSELAKLLAAPVLLVVNAASQARSVAALVQGFSRFDPDLRVEGVILNKVASPSHAELLEQAVVHYTGLPVVGKIPRDESLQVPERHLGLVPAWEDPAAGGFLDRLSEKAPGWFDLEAILRLAREALPFSEEAPSPSLPGATPGARIAYARDAALQFYYEDNLDLLRDLGAELVPFSLLTDERLPGEIGGLYFGGGFPEAFAEPLSRNEPLRRAIRQAIADEIPTYAECGGLMVLAGALKTRDGRLYEMCGVLPGIVEMTDRLQHFGYTTVTCRADTVLARKGDSARGHEFHYSRWEGPAELTAYDAVKRKGKGTRLEGFTRGNLLASYVHLHFSGCPDWARRFVEATTLFRTSRLGLAQTVGETRVVQPGIGEILRG